MKPQSVLHWSIAAAVVGVFLLDWITPRGWAVWILYLLPICGAYWSARRLASVQLTALCSILAVVGFFLSSSSVAPELAISNRVIGLVTFWIAAGFIVKEKNLEISLRESEERLKLSVESSLVSLAMFDREMRYLAASRSLLDSCFPGVGDVIGRRHYEIFPDCPERWRAAHRRGLAGEVVRQDEDSWTTADGRTLWGKYEVRPWYAADGSIGGIVLFVADITARKQAEIALRESEERLRRVSDIANVGLTRHSRDWIYLSANPAFAEIARKPLDQIVGRPMVEVLGAAGVETIRPYVERVLRGEHVTYEAQVPFVGAGPRYLNVSYTPDMDPTGQIVGWVASVTDITAHKHAEELLQKLNVSLEQRTGELHDQSEQLPRDPEHGG